MRGGVATIAGGSGGHFYGQNADHFVIGTGINPPDAYSDAPLDPDVYNETPGFNGYPYSTHHVASLVSETPEDDFDGGDLPGRTSRTVNGFMSGMGESSTGGAPYMLTSGVKVDPDGPGGDDPVLVPGANFSMQINPDNNSVSASGEVFNAQDTSDIHSMVMAFGSTDPNAGNNVFVDDHRYGARRNSDNSLTGIKLDVDPSTLIEHTSVQDETAGSYLVSGRASPVEGYEHCTECDFIDWGWWGTRVRVDQDPGSGEDIREEYVHMGTWVAGELTDPSGLASFDPGELPFGGTAVYQGTALGSVSSEGAQYIASGTVDMTYHFDQRYGEFNMQFDGHSVGGNLSDDYYNPTGKFSGSLTGSIDGFASGAFVDDPSLTDPRAAGAIGDFSLNGTNYSAVGTFATVGTNPF